MLDDSPQNLNSERIDTFMACVSNLRGTWLALRSLAFGSVISGALLSACSSSLNLAQVPRVPYVRLGQDEASTRPLFQPPVILVFEPGDPVHLDFILNSSVLETAEPRERVELRATQRFYLLIRSDGMPRISLDGENFDSAPQNAFRFGIAALKDNEPKVEVELHIRPKSEGAAKSKKSE
jgi:hypothetical protein